MPIAVAYHRVAGFLSRAGLLARPPVVRVFCGPVFVSLSWDRNALPPGAAVVTAGRQLIAVAAWGLWLRGVVKVTSTP